MEQSSLFRKSSMERIQSPEQLNDYLRVTNPSVWVLLAAVIILLAGMLIWGSVTYISSSVEGSAQVENGMMIIAFEDETLAKNVEAGMSVTVGDSQSVIQSVGHNENGSLFAWAETSLPDGVYQVTVSYKQTQVWKLLFN